MPRSNDKHASVAILYKHCLVIPVDLIEGEYGKDAYRKIMKKLTLLTKNFNFGMTSLRLYKLFSVPIKIGKKTLKKKHIMIPKGVLTLKDKRVTLQFSKRVSFTFDYIKGIPKPEKAVPYIDDVYDNLRHNQQLAVNMMLDEVFNSKALRRGNACCTLVLPAGQGKTRTALALVNYLRYKTIVVVSSIYLLNQWVEEIQAIFGDKVTIGKYYGKEKTFGDITVGVVNSLLDTTEDLSTHGLAIYDEIQLYCTKKYSQIFFKVGCKANLGLTATPDARTDDFGATIGIHAGRLLVMEEQPEYVQDTTPFMGTVIGIRYNNPTEYNVPVLSEAHTVIAIETIKKLVEDPARVNLVTTLTKFIYEELHNNAYVFSELRAYVDVLRDEAREHGIPYVIEEDTVKHSDGSHKIIGGATVEDRERALEFTKRCVVYTTYGCSSVGVSISKMTACIFSTPRRSGFVQKVGRILRMNSDHSIRRYVFDIIDNKSALKGQIYDRKKAYKVYNFEYKELTVDPEKGIDLSSLRDLVK